MASITIRKLEDAAKTIEDMDKPGHRLHKLTGD